MPLGIVSLVIYVAPEDLAPLRQLSRARRATGVAAQLPDTVGVHCPPTRNEIHVGRRATARLDGSQVILCRCERDPGSRATLSVLGTTARHRLRRIAGDAASGVVEVESRPTCQPGSRVDAAGEFDEVIAAMRGGVTYANVHPARLPG